MSQYILRLDDASDYMDIQNWIRMEKLLDKYDIKPIFGIIPKNCDDSLVSKYEQNLNFWGLMHSWINKGWIPALHGYEHRYVTKEGGINPVNMRSEFAGLPYIKQVEKIKNGFQILDNHNIHPNIFFAPSHTFDKNTLRAIRDETPIRIISDSIARDVYKDDGLWFIPQQSGSARKLPFKTVTFCYHPNTMNESSFDHLEKFIDKNIHSFNSLNLAQIMQSTRSFDCIDKILRALYFCARNRRKQI